MYLALSTPLRPSEARPPQARQLPALPRGKARTYPGGRSRLRFVVLTNRMIARRLLRPGTRPGALRLKKLWAARVLPAHSFSSLAEVEPKLVGVTSPAPLYDACAVFGAAVIHGNEQVRVVILQGAKVTGDRVPVLVGMAVARPGDDLRLVVLAPAGHTQALFAGPDDGPETAGAFAVARAWTSDRARAASSAVPRRRTAAASTPGKPMAIRSGSAAAEAPSL